MTRQRIRMRFRKTGDLRLISHRDLARAFERWLRRAGLPLRMSEGFHPKAKISFPSALALGIAGANEIMEFELAEPQTAGELRERLDRYRPDGLVIVDIRELSQGAGKAQVHRMVYSIPIPLHRMADAETGIRVWKETSPYLIPRAGREEPVDVKAGADQLEIHDGQLRFRLTASRTGGVRPRELLGALGVADLESEGYYLTRVDVEVAT